MQKIRAFSSFCKNAFSTAFQRSSERNELKERNKILGLVNSTGLNPRKKALAAQQIANYMTAQIPKRGFDLNGQAFLLSDESCKLISTEAGEKAYLELIHQNTGRSAKLWLTAKDKLMMPNKDELLNSSGEINLVLFGDEARNFSPKQLLGSISQIIRTQANQDGSHSIYFKSAFTRIREIKFPK